MYMSRKVSAQDCAVSMHHASLGGIVEALPYARRPGLQKGEYNEFLKGALGYKSDSTSLYTLMDLPCKLPGVMGRSHMDLQVMPGHELFYDSTAADMDRLTALLREHKAEDKLPPAYFDHVVVRENPDEDVFPGAIFVDGVQYSNNDSTIGFWLIEILTGRRHLMIPLRKKLLCGCGCRGWCTLYGIFVFLSWVLRSLATNVFPSERHDKRPWASSDAVRIARQGAAIGARFACLYVKLDWMEVGTTFGLSGHGDGIRPCFKCNCTRENMHNTETASSAGLPWQENQPGDYDNACARCELVITLSYADYVTLSGVLTDFDRRRDGALGRALSRDIFMGGVQLRKGDRLEPCEAVPDTGNAFDVLDASVFPLRVVFWRRAAETLARRRNPIFDSAYGVTVERSLTVDTLHALYLGIMLNLVRFVLWFLVDSRIWGEHGTQEESYLVNVAGLGAALKAWYARRHRERPGEGLTRVTDLKKVMGSHDDRKLSSKGAETFGLLCFLVSLLETQRARLPAAAGPLLEACHALERLVEIWRDHGANLGPAITQESWDLLHRCYSRTKPLVEDMLVPKRHICVHLLKDMDYFGNPTLYQLFYDESLNKMFKQYLRTVSQASFEPFVLLRMRDGLELEEKRLQNVVAKRKRD
jgi:hypothetical protein